MPSVSTYSAFRRCRARATSDKATWDAAIAYATRRHAMVIVDPPAAWTAAKNISEAAVAACVSRSSNAALYFPRLKAPDPLRRQRIANFAPCGAVAGIYARIDGARGVWKAPAGAEASVLGAQGLSVALTEAQLSALEARASTCCVCCPAAPSCCGVRERWRESDAAEPQFKYVPVRRLAHVHRGEHHPRPAVDRARAPRRAAMGTGPRARCEFRQRPVSAGRLAGQRSRRRPISCAATPPP